MDKNEWAVLVQAGVSQREFGTLLKVSITTVNNWSTGRFPIGVKNVPRVERLIVALKNAVAAKDLPTVSTGLQRTRDIRDAVVKHLPKKEV